MSADNPTYKVICECGYTVEGLTVGRANQFAMQHDGPEFRTDSGNLTPQAGDQVYNTDATEAQGAGPSLYTGSAWKNLAA